MEHVAGVSRGCDDGDGQGERLGPYPRPMEPYRCLHCNGLLVEDPKRPEGERTFCADCGRPCRKPVVKLVGADGNVFNLIGLAADALKLAGQRDAAKEMTARCFAAHSYQEALAIIAEYLEIQ